MKAKKSARSQQINLVMDEVFSKNLIELKKLHPSIKSQSSRIRLAVDEYVRAKKAAK